MPYVPTDDRPELDAAIEVEARRIAETTTNNFSVLGAYLKLFSDVGNALAFHGTFAHPLATAILEAGKKHGYEGAFLGELNYSITRLIQRVPQIKVELGHWQASSELRYWLYAVTVEALIAAADNFKSYGLGIGGVFEDIKDEYKRRVNTSYESAQIVKSGDCYDTPYYTRLVEVLDADGNHIGYQEVMVARSAKTISKDVIDAQVILQNVKETSNAQ